MSWSASRTFLPILWSSIGQPCLKSNQAIAQYESSSSQYSFSPCLFPFQLYRFRLAVPTHDLLHSPVRFWIHLRSTRECSKYPLHACQNLSSAFSYCWWLYPRIIPFSRCHSPLDRYQRTCFHFCLSILRHHPYSVRPLHSTFSFSSKLNPFWQWFS